MLPFLEDQPDNEIEYKNRCDDDPGELKHGHFVTATGHPSEAAGAAAHGSGHVGKDFALSWDAC